MTYTITKPDRHLSGDIHLDGSKSISNRALLIRALCSGAFGIQGISTSKDTQLLQALLDSDAEVLDAGAAGTTFRFLTAYLALKTEAPRTLTGTGRMKERPIGPLVEALRKLGARINYLEKEGFPPLQIHPPGPTTTTELTMPADVSSQFVSALAMLAPTLPNGLTIRLEGEVASLPYLEMTLRMMDFFGVKSDWAGDTIRILPQAYQPKDLLVEADWSAAGYWYLMAAFSEKCELTLHGLFAESMQGDSVLPGLMANFGVATEFAPKESIRAAGKITLRKSGEVQPLFEQNFRPCPDLAPTFAVACTGLGVQGLFTGLETLRVKETDRIAALQEELAKVNCSLSRLPGRFSRRSDADFFMVEGKADVSSSPVFSTYDDHRMAMAFAPLGLFGEIKIEDPGVVEKSYPAFWEDLRKVGFRVEVQNQGANSNSKLPD